MTHILFLIFINYQYSEPGILHSMIQFLLICPTSALGKFLILKICCIFIRLKTLSALNLNKFPKNLMIELQETVKSRNMNNCCIPKAYNRNLLFVKNSMRNYWKPGI